MESELVPGSNGIFEISVHGQVVAKRGFTGFPTEQEIVDAVAKALPAMPPASGGA